MSIVETLRADFEEEMPSTRKVIERAPGDRGEWRPHPKSFPIGHLAQLVSWMPGWITSIVNSPTLDLMTAPRYSFEATDTLLEGFDRNVREAHAALLTLDDSMLDRPWSLVAGDKTLIHSTLGASARQTIRHLVHHRAQLTVYLRLLDIPVPCTYGPTADDRGTFPF
ncbi:MAG: DinB family protein [Gemmatimonadota bacterium]